MAENQAASSGLFAVFMLSIYSLFLIPYTIYRLCAGGDEVTTQPVVKVGTAAVGWVDVQFQTVQLRPHMGLVALACAYSSHCCCLCLQSKKQSGFADKLKGLCTKRKNSCFWAAGGGLPWHDS